MPKPNHVIKNAVDHLDRLNKKYPNLRSDYTEKTVIKLRSLFGQIEQGMPEKLKTKATAMPEFVSKTTQTTAAPVLVGATKQKNSKQINNELLESVFSRLPIDEALAEIQSQFPQVKSMNDLLAENDHRFYIRSLRKEAKEFQHNQISIPQIAQIWQDMDRPSLGSERWNERAVSMILS